MTTRTDRYQIVRFYRDERVPRKVKGNLTLKEAQAHCLKSSTHGGAYCWRCGRVAPDSMTQAHPKYPSFCPTCGEATVVEWFDGYDFEGPTYGSKEQRPIEAGGRG